MKMHYFAILILSFILIGVGVGLYIADFGPAVVSPIYVGLIAGGAVVFFVWVALFVYKETKKQGPG